MLRMWKHLKLTLILFLIRPSLFVDWVFPADQHKKFWGVLRKIARPRVRFVMRCDGIYVEEIDSSDSDEPSAR